MVEIVENRTDTDDTFDSEQAEMETKPLTDWENEPDVTDLKKDLEEANPHHQTHVTDVNTWLDHLNVTGTAKIEKVTGRSTIVPKLIRKQAEWRYAALSEAFLSDENIYKCEPVSWEDARAAQQNELLINNQFNTKLDKVAFIDEYVRTAVDEGTAIVRVGWDFFEEERETPVYETVPVQDEPTQQLMLMAMQDIMQDQSLEANYSYEFLRNLEASAAAGQPVQLQQSGTEMKMTTVTNQPTLEVCDYNSVILDPTCKGDIKKANFVIYRFETNLSELRKADHYFNLDQIKIEANQIQNEPDYGQEDTSSFNFTDKPRKKFIAYEYWGYWDIDDTGIAEPIVATWAGDTMIRMERSPFPDEGLPFVSVQYLPKRKNVYGEPDGALLLENQQIAGAVTRGMLDILGRSAVGQTGIRKDALDITNQRKYDSGLDYQFNSQVDAASAFFQHTYPDIPASAQYMLDLVNLDAESLTGVKAFSQQGISGEGLGRSATAAKSALDAASKREIGILRRLASGLVEIGRKVASMNGEFLSEEEVVRVTNEDFVTVRRDDLAGRYDVKMNISTAETDNSKAQELAFMLQTMGNTMPQEMSQLVLEDIARLRKMPELAKKIHEYQPQPDPMQQQIQALEIAKLEAEIKKIESETIENLAEAELDQAKAEEAASTKDQKDLDFLEQSEGVTHSRNMQQDAAQAEANLTRDIVNLALKGGNEGNNSTP
jgi:hypothetical protein